MNFKSPKDFSQALTGSASCTLGTCSVFASYFLGASFFGASLFFSSFESFFSSFYSLGFSILRSKFGVIVF